MKQAVHQKVLNLTYSLLGDTLLENHLLEDTDLNMDLIYTVIDYYRHAMVLTRGVEVKIIFLSCALRLVLERISE